MKATELVHEAVYMCMHCYILYKTSLHVRTEANRASLMVDMSIHDKIEKHGAKLAWGKLAHTCSS